MTIHNETDLLALTRAEKKLHHWQSLNAKGVTVITSHDEGIIYEVNERVEYWLRQVQKYRLRIQSHVEEFQKVNDFWAFTNWVTGIIETIRDIIKSLTK